MAKTDRRLPSAAVIKAMGVTVQLTGAVMDDDAVMVMAHDLAHYPDEQVLAALERCRRELRPRQFCLAEVLRRIDDGHPGVEEAWAICCRLDDEGETVVWTQVMQEAYQAAKPLLQERDHVAARMAFKEAYVAALDEARLYRIGPQWAVSLGMDPLRKERALIEAEARGRITQDERIELCPPDRLQIAMDEQPSGQKGAEPLRLTFDESVAARDAKALCKALAMQWRVDDAMGRSTARAEQEALAARKAETARKVETYLSKGA